MRYVSTAGEAPAVDLERALFSGPAPDGGLYVPERLPTVDVGAVRSAGRRFADTASVVAIALFGDDMPERDVDAIVRSSFDFEVPLVPIEPGYQSLELFHGPTLAFKDVGARFMARLMLRFKESRDRGRGRGRGRESTVLVATSGDTGSAAAHAFHGLEGFQVVVLFPRGKVSEVQRKLFTTLGGNVRSIAIDGAFDDCQRLVKEAFRDSSLGAEGDLVSANSINVGRLLPQTFYYFHIATQLELDGSSRTIVATPSGNFGNLTAGLLAKRMGLPVHRFVAATNVNDVVPEYLRTGSFRPRPAVVTLSNAMDVGEPSNFVRMRWLYHDDWDALRNDVVGSRHTDDETLATMRAVYERTGYLLDPHTAVGFLGAEVAKNLIGSNGDAVVLATAHPGKSDETVRRALGKAVPLHEVLAALEPLEESVTDMPADYTSFREFLAS